MLIAGGGGRVGRLRYIRDGEVGRLFSGVKLATGDWQFSDALFL